MHPFRVCVCFLNQPPKVQPYVPVVGGGNGSCRLTGLCKLCVRLATPSRKIIATETDDQRNTQPQNERDRSEPGTGRMTAKRKIRPPLSPKSKYRNGTWNFRTMFQTWKTAHVRVEKEMSPFRSDILDITECR